MTSQQNKDHWSSEQYQAAASFVPQLTTKVITYLNPSPHDRILDIGCGDGVLTNAIARSCKEIVGYDSSQSMIATAQQRAAQDTVSNVSYQVVDCTRLASHPSFQSESFDKVFSNAALHWILRNTSTRSNVFRDIFTALKPGGAFVFECGGAGNVAEVVTALIGALVHVAGISIAQANALIPWYFASETWTTKHLEDAGFAVEIVELEYRPTTLKQSSTEQQQQQQHGQSQGQGVEGWIRLFAASILDTLPEQIRDEVVKYTAATLEWSTSRDDGSQVIGYVRLRAVAKKPELKN